MNIIITGASSGIGYSLSKYLISNQENNVFVFARSGDKLKKLESEIVSIPEHGEFYYKVFDLESGDITKELIPEIIEAFGNVDILINNAGLLISKHFEDLTDGDFDNMFNVNVKSIFRLVKNLLPYFSDNAHIVNMSSMGGVQGSAKFPGLSLYSASKGAVSILTECLAEELKENNIKVNALAIGAVQTEMLSSAFPGYKAPLLADEMAEYIGEFALKGHKSYNGKVLPVSVSTP